MIAASFWTDSKYRAMAEKVAASAERFGIHTVQKEYPPTAKWSGALAYKPDLILETLDANPGEDVLYLDADTEIVARPSLLLAPGDFDVAINFLSPNLPHGCVIFWRNNDRARLLCRRWKAMREAYPFVRLDEIHFLYAYRELKGKVRVLHLPPAYAWMEEQMRGSFPGAEPVILHFGSGRGSDKAEVMREQSLAGL